MKWLVIFLLVVNVALFSWQFNEHVRAQTLTAMGLPDLPSGAPQLRLVSELAQLPPLRAAAAKERNEAALALANESTEDSINAVDLNTEINSNAKASNTCVTIGPIQSDEQLANLRAWLRERTTALHTRSDAVKERRFFWVYLEPASEQEAKEELSNLARLGVKDYMLVRRGGLKNAISLGLFRSQDSVNRRLAEMGRQGFKPVVVPKFETKKHHWLQATMAVGAEDTAAIPPEIISDVELQAGDCKNAPNIAEIEST